MPRKKQQNTLTHFRTARAGANAQRTEKAFDLEAHPGFRWVGQNRFMFTHGDTTVNIVYDFSHAGWHCDNGIFFHRDTTAAEMRETLAELMSDDIPFDGRPVAPLEAGTESEQYF